ncbi:hypothetical protein WR25_13619 [Diploscapter pachys]|uniref:Beta-1,4-N-acetylgalactosaminyltransferase n=1 Tax=Diploscapter pachys TaxID=2018661 RepID=A0A2A2KPP7_9BILA|nr:hypothetical protein WR25_13619 [Diploscapter pachys]
MARLPRSAATLKRFFLLVSLLFAFYILLSYRATSNNSSGVADRTNANIEVHKAEHGPSLNNVHHNEAELNKEVRDPIELENARQTLMFFSMADENKEAHTTVHANLLDGTCPSIDNLPDLWGALPQATLLIQNLQERDVEEAHKEITIGGSWAPKDCKARNRIAIIIPYRDRQSHLTRLIDFLIPILQRQRLDFRFIVTEQYGNGLFNKGRIMNAAFKFAEQLHVDCVVFHDVDMFPQDDRNPYSCPPSPRHLGAFVSNLGYQLWYKEIVGGALAISMRDYKAINGYSNMYWGWGGEDDDMGKRILSLNYTIERPNADTGRYSMLKHVKRKRTAPKLIYKLLENSEHRVTYDGLNETDKWNILKITPRPLYYHLYVDVGVAPDEWNAKS